MGKLVETDDDRIWNEALDWLLRLQAQPDDLHLKAAFEAWTAANDAYAAAFAEAEHVWRLTRPASLLDAARTYPVTTTEEQGERNHVRSDSHGDREPGVSVRIPSRLRLRSQPRHTDGRRAKRLATACGIGAVAACLAFLLLPTVLLRLSADYVTQVGETRLVTLDDGTQVYLNTDSALRIAYTPERRQVELLAGEAFFSVTPDPARAFLVRAGRGTVRVRGTAFQVCLDQPSLSIAVQNGVVDVSLAPPAGLESRGLRKGQALRLNLTTGVAEPYRAAPDRIAAWRDDQLIVDRWTVGEAVNELARYHRGVILLTDAALARQPISGVYDLKDPVAAVKAVVHPHAATVWQMTPYVLIISAG